jgi:thiamine-monophosphate kinase
MGASPHAALLSLALPPTLDVATFEQLLDGLLALAAVHRVTLIGGNITQTPGPLTLDVTAIGSVRPRRILTRGGAHPGDDVYVTGTLGEAAVGLQKLQATGLGAGWPSDACVKRYLKPDPRVRAGMLLGRNRAASSCMDVSDGLADCVRQVAEASEVGITLDGSVIPISAEVRDTQHRRVRDPLEPALSGGDDYELFFTVRPAHRGRLRAVSQQLGDLPITRIGVVTKARELLIRDQEGIRTLPSGYEHFK